MQTRVYPALLVQAGVHLNGGQPFAPEQIEMVYWFADFPDQPAHFPYSAAHFQRDWDLLTRLADEVLTLATYPLTEEAAKCQYCSYRSYCERGAQAGDLDQAEAELESEALFDVNFEQVGEIEF